VRVAIVAESFLPQVNGVANSVRHLVDYLIGHGHDALVVAPGPGKPGYRGVPVVRVRSLPLPMYPDLPLGLPDGAIRKAILGFRPDVVHLASPVVLGLSGLKVAERAGLPTVAVYQTDVVGFAQQYGFVGVERTIRSWTRRLYVRTDRVLAPSNAAAEQLREIGVPEVFRWQRGVDLRQFHPARRDPELRRALAPNGETLVGYVGRVATEKRVHLLGQLSGLPGVRLVVVGDGPASAELRETVPDAAFLGMLRGVELARAAASLDVFVHTGAHETFCQAAQEALASGVPVVAPAAGGLLDLIEPGRTGLLYPPDESDAAKAALRSAVRTLASSPSLRLAMAAATRRSVLDRSWDRIFDELVQQHYTPLRRTGVPYLAA
jgi:phosphatidylinositol alpha 1,6-mannosyltransferase